MFFSHQLGTNQKIPFRTKLSLVFWIILTLAFLSFFAFGIFLIALMVGLVVFTTKLFYKKDKPDSIPYTDFKTRPYTPHRNIKNDDDVIDI